MISNANSRASGASGASRTSGTSIGNASATSSTSTTSTTSATIDSGSIVTLVMVAEPLVPRPLQPTLRAALRLLHLALHAASKPMMART